MLRRIVLASVCILISTVAFAELPQSTSYQVTAETTAAAGGTSVSGNYSNQGVLGQGSPLGTATAQVSGQVNLAGYLNSANATLDADGDLLANLFDNCWHMANNNQTNFDLDAWGDVCDPDDDNDSLTDTWELRYQLNPFDAGDAGEDSDGDGQSNVDEFLAGTDPFRTGVLPQGYAMPMLNTPLLLAPEDGPVDGQRQLP